MVQFSLPALKSVSGALQVTCDVRMDQKALSHRDTTFILYSEVDIQNFKKRTAINV